MLPARDHDQNRSAGRPGAASRLAASHAPHTCADQFQFSPHSSRGRAGCERARANCGRHRASALFFVPRGVTLDDIHDLRICELTGRQPVLARAQSISDHAHAHFTVGAQVGSHSLERLSSSRLDSQQPIETEEQERGRFIQGRGGLIQELGARCD